MCRWKCIKSGRECKLSDIWWSFHVDMQTHSIWFCFHPLMLQMFQRVGSTGVRERIRQRSRVTIVSRAFPLVTPFCARRSTECPPEP